MHGAVFGRSQTITGVIHHHSHRTFSRNDSSNSTTSSNTNSYNETASSPNGTGHTIRYGCSNSVNASPVHSLAGGCTSPIPMHRPGHTKASAKSSVQSKNESLNNYSISSSLRRQRFRQQHQTKLRDARLAKQASSGTSLSTSQELSTSGGTSITANPLIDKLLDFIRENYGKSIDPIRWNIEKKIRLASFGKLCVHGFGSCCCCPEYLILVLIISLSFCLAASFRFESGLLYGTSNFERIGDAKLIKPLDELTQIILAANIQFSDLLAQILFSTRFARFTMRNKQLRVFVEKCIVYVEISIDHTMSAKLKTLRLISMDGLETKTRGVAFPINKSFEAFASKTIYNIAKHSDQYIEQLVPLINRFCDNYFENALKSMSITDLFW